MKILRPITLNDQEAFEQFAFRSHLGLTSLPKDPDLLHKKILDSLHAFSNQRQDPHTSLYLFVLEDLQTKELIGTSAVRAKTGGTNPLFFYRIEEDPTGSSYEHVPPFIPLIKAIKYEEGPAEIGGLYLVPEHRKEGAGRLLSLGRFLFMATFSKRFDENVFADMRGVFDEHEHNLFWDAIGRHFFDVPLETALSMASRDKTFVEKILPKFPIYLQLLPDEVKKVIGNIHPNTRPALKLLEGEGFKFCNEINVFDGGPKLESKTADVRCIKESQTAQVKKIIDVSPNITTEFIICNTSLEFRACLGHLELQSPDEAIISQEIAGALQVSSGDTIRYVKSHTS